MSVTLRCRVERHGAGGAGGAVPAGGLRDRVHGPGLRAVRAGAAAARAAAPGAGDT